jgi:hypothetical protein
MGFIDKAKDALPDSVDDAKSKAGDLKGKAADVAGTVKDKAQGVAQKLDDKAEEMSQKDGVVGKVAGAAHTVLDKIDGDATPGAAGESVSGGVDPAGDAAMAADVAASPSEAIRDTRDASGTSI